MYFFIILPPQMKMIMTKTTRFFVGFFIAAFALVACKEGQNPNLGKGQNSPDDSLALVEQAGDTLTLLDRLKEKGVLVAVTNCGDINYTMFSSHPNGFEYELLKDFCNATDLELEVIVNDDLDSCFQLLDSCKVDVVATGVGLTKELKKRYFLTNPIFSEKSVLVQRMPRDWNSMSTGNEIENQLLRSPLDLAGKTIHVPKGSHAVKLLEYLSEGIGDTIYVVENDTLNSIELMHAVHDGLIDYAVVDEYMVTMVSYGLSGLDTKLAVSVEQPLGWALKSHPTDSSLLYAFNDWIEGVEQKHLNRVILKYAKNVRYRSTRKELPNGHLSAFDNEIKRTAKKIGWDWRLLAALIYQESRFKIDLESEKGAFGLMQLMPSVMKRYEIDYDSSPEEQMEAGGKLIKYLDKSLQSKVTDSLERMKFVLAAYNAGLGHVLDAQRLAVKYGKAPDIWENNVDFFILNKSKSQYYNDTCCKCGYLRGTETYRFVEEIMERFNNYKTMLD